ncbi:MAG TPA: YeeE/YedE thiosulfate transporter family protein [Kofleriaceae bacterium]|nr:YeeE/YedE thiosulfate transporter family protein [Kofleriaceae bacterium]
MHDFTPVHALVGGALIATSLAIMLIGTGRIAGLSGIFAGFVRGARGDWAWRAWFLAGMLAVGVAFRIARPETYDYAARVPLWAVALSGVLVGVGTRASNGCTSGHGLCGISRFSKRSIIATMVFFGVGVATATLVGHFVRAA